MRLTLKITIAILLGVALLFSLNSYLSIQRERAQLKERLSREARHLGESLRVMLTEIWRIGGEQAAIGFLENSNLVSGPLKVRWVWLEGQAAPRYLPRFSRDELSPLQKGETFSLLAESKEGHDFLVTYLPVMTAGGRPGAIEVSESLDELHGYVRESLRRSALLMVATIGSGLLLMTVLGSFWINRPVRKLTEQAERIGAGDFSTAVTVSGRDELAILAGTIDRMRSQLAEAREAEQAANHAKIQALEKLRHTERLATVGRLSAGMAHELGTPLNVISGRAKLIAGQDLSPEETARSARIIGEQAERMTAIMRQLLDFARRGQARKQPVELSGLIKGTLDLLAPTARNQGIDLHWEAEEGSLTVNADPGQLQQVLLNLAMNGIQSMPEGGRLSLQLKKDCASSPPEGRAAENGSWCCIRVEDQGVGIAPENLSHIFDPFYTTKDVGRGTGLGLSIAYGIAEEHGGWIEVASTPSEGSCFSVFLPQATRGEKG
ncbi:sensor histidine kinase [Desulfuromonas sp. TF]|uniref:sensor histidine kinase n=1 Tax=Desulfuromonas sp. TF TaxID=1232410 RepID=UPI00042795EB|nr:ATP-binding protein [Desulfuromonas sp. TF]